MFRTVFPYRNKKGQLIMDTEKVHSIKHCGLEISNYANPINTSCDGPEGGHKLWVKGQGGNTNLGPSVSFSMMQQCVHKEASSCFVKQCRHEWRMEIQTRNGLTIRAVRCAPIAGGTLVKVLNKAIQDMGHAWASG